MVWMATLTTMEDPYRNSSTLLMGDPKRHKASERPTRQLMVSVWSGMQSGDSLNTGNRI